MQQVLMILEICCNNFKLSFRQICWKLLFKEFPMLLPKEIQNLSDLFSRLPNIGPKLSNRLALFLAISGKDLSKRLSKSLAEVIENIRTCDECGNVTTSQICDICSNDSRDKKTILIVEDPLDLVNIESTGEYHGLYHVLNGVISPINGVGPEELNLKKLNQRVESLQIEEIIFALNPNLEGDATSLFIKQDIERIKPTVKFTRLAKGIPAGGDIEFVSNQTIVDSMKSRTNF